MLTQADVHWIELDSVDSTNDYLSRAYLQGRVSGVTAVLAHSQTAGRGRAARRWQALPGASVCLSIGLPMAGHTVSFLPLCVGVAVAQVIEKLQVPVRLKWPNDLLVGQKKLGGVLCESFQCDSGPVTVVGLGVNLLQPSVPEALGGQGATGLVEHLCGQAPPQVRELADHFVSAVLHAIHAASAQGIGTIFREFNRLDSWLGCDVQVIDNGTVHLQGKAMGINEQGAYLINTDEEGLVALNAGDLSLRVRA
ncbi:MAG: biotin--[acetyl-CoA-carboxylase] ligase [Gammaproteobacteria bacterium]|nr:biotin--[acetyl-CoA-carboxylase] ligase [Gammaproteobacteria bacterium]MBU0849968.1 biotin--[acetyl-CoA-carboxylase] ligase [Gammaproteobacteria bacterium]MBU1266796.1 biotin--[acetyl-CoA-carboxylase] ligase [Gammaproteobacteria bacterium]MBU1528600.1 biotin--[acetyl-CoA-carboxylase] ligase [Gammaproteobacteria bacterium]MBU1781280.1 biotin--[acetyl-CoA-carboxylase] ligase [Gammaproteobacteria bacterium]